MLDATNRVREVTARLEARYGVAVREGASDAVEMLVACILSQHTSDANSHRAFESLRARFASWEAVVEAPTPAVAEAIRGAGLANTKAPRIQEALRMVREREGRFDLERLAGLPDADARHYLMSLPGVGPKTAAIVLCFALGRPVLPVDTHVFRVSWRLGLVDRRRGEGRAHDALGAIVPPELVYRFHMALIRHGRQVCRAPEPRCGLCPLTDLCAYYAACVAPAAPAQRDD